MEKSEIGNTINIEPVEIEFPGGATIEYCAKRAVERASLMGTPVQFKFSNIIVVATADSHPDTLVEKWREELEGPKQ